MIRCINYLHLQLMQTLPGVFVINTNASVQDLSEPGANERYVTAKSCNGKADCPKPQNDYPLFYARTSEKYLFLSKHACSSRYR